MKVMIQKYFRLTRSGNERGFTLLEYCAGAAVLITIVYAALNTLGTNLSSFLTEIGSWAQRQSQIVKTK